MTNFAAVKTNWVQKVFYKPLLIRKKVKFNNISYEDDSK